MGEALRSVSATSQTAQADTSRGVSDRASLTKPFTKQDQALARATLADFNVSIGLGVPTYGVPTIPYGWRPIPALPPRPLPGLCIVQNGYGNYYQVPCNNGIIPPLPPGFFLRRGPHLPPPFQGPPGGHHHRRW